MAKQLPGQTQQLAKSLPACFVSVKVIQIGLWRMSSGWTMSTVTTR